MKRTQQLIELLLGGKLTDEEIAQKLNLPKNVVQEVIHHINFGKKFKYSILRSGKYGYYQREIVEDNSDHGDIILNGDRYGRKAINQFYGRKKLLMIGLATRQGKANRERFAYAILKQNLDLSVAAQGLLQ